MDQNTDTEDTTIYKVVMNHEEQYSIWPDYKGIPQGWTDVGRRGSKSECLAFIKEVWTDMRPLSLRKKMEEFARNPPPLLSSPDSIASSGKSLIDRLCEGDHAVKVGLRPESSVKRFKEAIDRDYVHIKFTETNGGTELGIRLDQNTSDFTAADFKNGKGTVHIEGNLTVDYVKIKCVADIDLSTLQGRGTLIKAEAEEMYVASARS